MRALRRIGKEVQYSLSSNHQSVLSALWRELPATLSEKAHAHWADALCLLGPIAAAVGFALSFSRALAPQLSLIPLCVARGWQIRALVQGTREARGTLLISSV